MSRKTLESAPVTIDQSIENIQAARNLAWAATSLFVALPHETLHSDAEAVAREAGLEQPVQESIYYTCSCIGNIASMGVLEHTELNSAELMTSAAMLIQFTNHVPALQDVVAVSQEPMQVLHQAVVDTAERAGPLTYSDQFRLSMEVHGNSVENALWGLFIASRMYARMLDTQIIPDYDRTSYADRMEDMLAWRYAIAACKPAQDGVQDPAGDTYYTWTHALAQVLYANSDRKLWNKYVRSVFRDGTSIMHSFVHKIRKQAVQNDHRLAAQYGNSIGEAIVRTSRG